MNSGPWLPTENRRLPNSWACTENLHTAYFLAKICSIDSKSINRVCDAFKVFYTKMDNCISPVKNHFDCMNNSGRRTFFVTAFCIIVLHYLCHFVHIVILIVSSKLYRACTLALINAAANEALIGGKNTHTSTNILLTSLKLIVENSCGNPAAVKHNCWCLCTAAEQWQQNTTAIITGSTLLSSITLTKSLQTTYTHEETTVQKNTLFQFNQLSDWGDVFKLHIFSDQWSKTKIFNLQKYRTEKKMEGEHCYHFWWIHDFHSQ